MHPLRIGGKVVVFILDATLLFPFRIINNKIYSSNINTNRCNSLREKKIHIMD